MAAAEEVVQDKVTSVREDLEAAFRAHADQDSPDTQAASPEPAEARPRDESGRFAPKEVKDDPKQAERADPASDKLRGPADKGAAAVAEGKTAESALAAGASGPSARVQPTDGSRPAEVTAAPQGWSLGAKAKWAELPPDIRAEISKRETDMHRFATKDDDERKFARSMYQAVSPYEAAFRSEGVSAPQYVANVLNVAYTLRTADPFTKAQTLATLAQQFGVDLKLLAPTTDGQPQNPEIAALRQQYSELHNERQREKQERERAAQEARQREEQEVQQAIHTFASDPAHKYIQAVAPVMGALLQSGQAQTMKEAYEMAIYARPDIRAQLQAEEKAKQEAAAAAARKAEEAKRKGKSIRGGPGGSMPAAPNPNASVREDLEAAFADARGRI